MAHGSRGCDALCSQPVPSRGPVMSAHGSTEGATAGILLGWTPSDGEVKEREARPISTALSERDRAGQVSYTHAHLATSRKWT